MLAETVLNHQSALEFVTFNVAGQSFCLEITKIREIRRWVPVTTLPHSEPDILGVMNLRGTVIPIMDLGVRLGLKTSEPDARSVVIIVSTELHTVGLVVESVSEILSIAEEDIQETPNTQSTDLQRSIRGLVTNEEGMTRVIDLGPILEKNTGLVP